MQRLYVSLFRLTRDLDDFALDAHLDLMRNFGPEFALGTFTRTTLSSNDFDSVEESISGVFMPHVLSFRAQTEQISSANFRFFGLTIHQKSFRRREHADSKPLTNRSDLGNAHVHSAAGTANAPQS